MEDTRASIIADAFEKIESEESSAVDVQVEAVESTAETPEQAEQRERDEKGRFASRQEQNNNTVDNQQSVEKAPIQRPSTWKKEYWPLYDKLAQGQALSPDEAKKLADYTNERENQFKSGVSTYKAEAEAAREVQGAIAPFMPDLQRYNIRPGEWIANLGNAHRTLALGSPQEKMRAFHQLARDYGVDLSSLTGAPVQQGQTDPQIQWLTDQLKQVTGSVRQWQTAQQQREQQELMGQIEGVRSEKGPNGQLLRPHFDEVKAQMSGLLSAGIAQDLKDAYDKAVRMNDDLWSQQQRASQAQASASRVASVQAVVQKARAAAISPRSASPSAAADTSAKGRRAQLTDLFESAGGGGRV